MYKYMLLVIIGLVVIPESNGGKILDGIKRNLKRSYEKVAAVVKKLDLPNMGAKLRLEAKRLAVGMQTAKNKIEKWTELLNMNKEAAREIAADLAEATGDLIRSVDGLKGTRSLETNSSHVIQDALETFKDTVDEFIDKLRSATGRVTTAAKDVTSAFEDAADTFIENVNAS